MRYSFPQLSCFDKYLLGCHLLESHDFTKQGEKKLEYKIYSLYCWSKLLYSHFSLKSAFVSQRPWYLPLYLPFYHSYWKHGNYGEILKLQASFWLHSRDMDAVLTPFLSLRLPLGGVHFFPMSMVLISCTMSQTSIHSSSCTLSSRSRPLNLYLSSTV